MNYEYELNEKYKYLKYSPSVMERWEYISYHTKYDIISNFENGLQILKDIVFESECFNRTLIAGGMAAFDKGIIRFLHKWNDKMEPLFLLSEVTGEFRRYTADEVQFPFICTPHLLSKEIVVCGINLDMLEDANQLYNKSEYIRVAVMNLNKQYNNLGLNYAVIWSYYAYKYINLLLDKLNPVRVILWNEFYPFHIIFDNICRERKIDIVFMEFGCIPGTFALDKKGQQGESWVALHRGKRYRDTSETKEIIHWIRNTRLNRNLQPPTQFNCTRISGYKKDKPIIVYLGQDDYESCLIPYTRKTKYYHSPFFKSSNAAAHVIERICQSNNWNFIYKIHPIMAQMGETYDLNPKTTGVVVNEVDLYSVIESADIVITILSQGSYHALIQEKPVIMLGYNQLRYKKCTYQLKYYSQWGLEHLMKKVLKRKFTDKQKRNFENHVTYLLKEYLYDDGLHNDMPFGISLM